MGEFDSKSPAPDKLRPGSRTKALAFLAIVAAFLPAMACVGTSDPNYAEVKATSEAYEASPEEVLLALEALPQQAITNSVVLMYKGFENHTMASGVILRDEGGEDPYMVRIFTALHPIRESGGVMELGIGQPQINGNDYRFQPEFFTILFNKDKDLAIIEITKDIPIDLFPDAQPISFADGPLTPGEAAYSLSYPGPLPVDFFPSIGTFWGEDQNEAVFDIAAWQGSSGGAIFNEDGEIVAIIMGGHENMIRASFVTNWDYVAITTNR